MASRSVLLLGDDLRRECQTRVAEILAADGLAAMWPEASTGRSACLAEGVEDWLAQFSPDIVVFGAGPWSREELAQPDAIEPESYAEYQVNIGHTAEQCRRACGRNVGFYSMAPFDAERLCGKGPLAACKDAATRLENAIPVYNRLAIDLLGSLNVMGVDLHRSLSPRSDEWLDDAGIRFTPAGREQLAQSIANLVYSVL